jgi:hypothetical protein
MITVLNLETLGASEYNLPWLDLAVYNNVIYGITENGIYSLEGDFTDTWEIETGELDFASSKNKIIDRLYLRGKAEEIDVMVTKNQEGVLLEEEYSIPEETNIRTCLLRLNRDVYGGSSFIFSLSASGPAIIESAEVNPILLRRNI